jgi:NAD(P)-dependent dehydrogenase (short-subunit alcohol dehydrogenase family)
MSDPSDEPFDLEGAVTVVTGATRGIGKAAALELGRAGAELVIVGRSTRERPDPFAPGTLEEVIEEFGGEGIEAIGVQADLLDPAQVNTVIERTLEWRGRCDVLINNAGYTSNGPILEVPARRWQNGFQMQVTTPLQLVQGFVPGMFERGTGRVLNIGTRAARDFLDNMGLYGVSKTAQERMTRFLDFEAGGRGVSFNVFCVDTVVTTEGWRTVMEQQGEEIAMGGATELVSPEECAAIITWMVRQPSSWSGRAPTIDEMRALMRAGAAS